MREMEFKVERSGLLKEGDIVNVIETELESFRYYTIEHAYGMSGNIPLTEPLKNLTGKVVKMEEKPRGFYAVLEFEEWIVKNRIFEKLENYWDTTKDKTGTVINLERQGNYKTAVEEFKSFVDPNSISDMPTIKYGVGLKGRLNGKLYSDLDAPGEISITVRPNSGTGGATLEIKLSTEKMFKIRFIENFNK